LVIGQNHSHFLNPPAIAISSSYVCAAIARPDLLAANSR